MLSSEQLTDVRAALERSQHPVFLYDNDADGLCSYVLLRRFLGRGKGIAVRTHPDIDCGYAHKAISLGADLIVVLDCPFLGEAFVNEVVAAGLPLVWIDHHVVDSPHYTHPSVQVFNPALYDVKSDEPVTYWCYQLTQRKEDIWIAMMGCIADHFLPPFVSEFAHRYPDLWRTGIRKPFDAYYESDLGKLAQALGFGLKDSVSHVVYLQNFLIVCSGPAALADELTSGSSFARKYADIKKRYDALFIDALQQPHGSFIFYRYGGTLSMSADLANALSHQYSGRYIVVAYVLGGACTMSLRGDRVKALLEELLPLFPHSRGGGHQDAVGARIDAGDLDRFAALFGDALSKRL